ncbi:hypothetical protein EMIT0P43_50014 [Pseudomonas jessenii]
MQEVSVKLTPIRWRMASYEATKKIADFASSYKNPNTPCCLFGIQPWLLLPPTPRSRTSTSC